MTEAIKPEVETWLTEIFLLKPSRASLLIQIAEWRGLAQRDLQS